MVPVHDRRFGKRCVVLCAAWMLALGAASATSAHAASPVALGTADSFALLAGSTITNTGPTTITGDIGLCCTGTAMTGFSEVTQPGGARHTGPNTPAATAQADLDVAYGDAAGRAITRTLPVDLSLSGTPATPLLPGVYDSTGHGVLQINTGLTLDFEGNPNAVFIFQGTTLTTAAAAAGSVNIVNGGASPSACNIFWQLSSDATGVSLGAGSAFKGTTMALGASVLGTGATVQGRILTRRSKAVTLDTNTITRSACATAAPAGGTTTTPTDSTTTTPGGSTTTPGETTQTTPGSDTGAGGGEDAGGGGANGNARGGGGAGADGDADAGGDAEGTGDGGGGTGSGAGGGDTAEDGAGGSSGSSELTSDTTSGTTTDSTGIPFTGLNILWLLLAAAAMLLTGTTLRRLGRRR